MRSVALGVWVGVGSRDETAVAGRRLALPRAPAVQGHRRGAARWTISAAIEAVGGETNAFTAKEYTCYYARVLDADLPLAVDVLSDLVTSSVLDAGRRRDRARRDPRRDRHARRRARRRGARPVRRAAIYGDIPLGRPIARHAPSRSRPLTRTADPRLLPPPLPARSTWSSPPPATSTTRARRPPGAARRSAPPAALDDVDRTRRAGPRGGGRRPADGSRRRRWSPGRPSRRTSCSACPGCAAATTGGSRWRCSTPCSAAA